VTRESLAAAAYQRAGEPAGRGAEQTAALNAAIERQQDFAARAPSLARPGSRSRSTASAPPQRGGDWGPSLSFSAPVGQLQNPHLRLDMGSRADAFEAVPLGAGRKAESEDLFAVLERRIAQQRDDLKAHRATIEETIEHDVQQLGHRVKQDEADLQNVYTKYREALDELARLRALSATQQLQVDEANSAAEDARAAADEAHEQVLAAQSRHAADVASLEAEIALLQEKEGVACEQAGRIEALQVALEAAKVDMAALREAQGKVAELETRLLSSVAAAEEASSLLEEVREQSPGTAKRALENPKEPWNSQKSFVNEP